MNNDAIIPGITEVIRTRRTVKPDKMNGRAIPEEIIHEMLENADWAPTHARTEPWRFVVYGQDKTKAFTRRHADLFREQMSEGFTQQKYDNIEKLGDNVSHIIVAWMKRVPNHKIPEIEEVAAASAAVQNVLLTATAHGVSSFWSTGGLTHHPAMSQELGLSDEDRILGIIYLGYSDQPAVPGNRMIPLADKIVWVR